MRKGRKDGVKKRDEAGDWREARKKEAGKKEKKRKKKKQAAPGGAKKKIEKEIKKTQAKARGVILEQDEETYSFF